MVRLGVASRKCSILSRLNKHHCDKNKNRFTEFCRGREGRCTPRGTAPAGCSAALSEGGAPPPSELHYTGLLIVTPLRVTYHCAAY